MGQRLARLDYVCRSFAAYSFRGPRSHRRQTVIIWYYVGDPIEGKRMSIWSRDFILHSEKYFRRINHGE